MHLHTSAFGGGPAPLLRDEQAPVTHSSSQEYVIKPINPLGSFYTRRNTSEEAESSA